MEIEEDEVKPGLAPWMATFADMMALLMCFFVLLLSFSEMDAQKYKEVAGSLANAFGVQTEVSAQGIPMGTSVIAEEFSSGRPQPTEENVVQQQTAQNMEMSLQTGQADFGLDFENISKEQAEEEAARELLLNKLDLLRQQTQDDVNKLEQAFEKEINDDLINIESGFRSITVRIREQGSFDSGSAVLKPGFVPVLEQLGVILGEEIDGKIAIEGHTDDVPISTSTIPSNWHLSALRALSVTNEILKDRLVNDDRLMVIGYGDTKPFVLNESEEGRAKNRRVEIVIHQPVEEEVSRELKQLQGINDDLLDTLQIDESELRALN